MRCTLLLLGAFVPAAAQSPADLFTKAPPHIDEALRARITKFYQAHVDGKFRVADQYVAEDSKDVFFESDKRRCKAFEIVKISYSDDFKKAQALTLCDSEMLMMPVGVQPVRIPLTSLWKRSDGDWYWYVIQRPDVDSPFGSLKPGAASAGGGMPLGAVSGPDAAAVVKMVVADTQELRFQADRGGTQEVKIANSMPGPITVEVDPVNFAGVEARVDQQQVPSGGSTKVFISYKPTKPLPGHQANVRIRIQPTGRVIPVNVLIIE